MSTKRIILSIILIFSLNFGQFPIELNPNEISNQINFNSEVNTEYLLTVYASSNTNWSEMNSESSTLTISIDGNWDNYNQDIILYAGTNLHYYHTSLGPITVGMHTLEFKFDYTKSSNNANQIIIDSIQLLDINTINIDDDVIKHSPILYGRDLLSPNESTHTDIPLILWHDISYEGTNKRIKYSIIFSNEDSRVGIGLAELMFSYGRTTDIEWAYEVLLSNDGNIINETFQGANHITTNFEGNKVGRHPILKNATLNCNFSDTGTSNYKFFLSPILTSSNQHTREFLMDENPWTYRIMAEELINEQRYEQNPDPESVIISDVRNYLYIEFTGETSNQNTVLDIAIRFLGSCETYVHHHNYPEFSNNYTGGIKRTSIELPNNFDPLTIHKLGFISNDNDDYNINITAISRIFYLDENYIPTNLDFIFSPFNISNLNTEEWIEINDNINNIDCLGITNGTALCDDCNVCNGLNIDMDDCNICFGNNENMDCNGICFGNSYEDECGICDDNNENNNSTCSGCTDSNAENYNPEAIFYDNSCIYSDNIFYVPLEYQSIQNAIYYSNSGDTIEVGPGKYYENINFMNKAITLRSQYENNNEISNFVINAIDSSSTVTIENIANGGSLYGFTITNGYGRGASFEDFISMASDEYMLDSLLTFVLKAGGISISNASPHLKDLIIDGNTARNVGGGIGLINSNAFIESCIISNNAILDGEGLGGGGIAINGGHPFLSDVIIKNNYVGSNLYSLNGGGGILCGFSIDNQILQLDMENVHIIGNIANIGAGVGALSGVLNGNRILIAENIGPYGSAIALGEPLGLVIGDILLNITNSTITNNEGILGVGMINSANLNAINTIFWDNGDIEFSPLPNNDQLNLHINYSNSNDIWPGIENINSNPQFINIKNSDYSLSSDSPCIDAGTADLNLDGIDDIFDYFGINPDIGALEYIDIDCETTGDINGDNNINILDIINVANCILSNCNNNCADLNIDGSIDILDIINLINIILG